MSGWRMEVPPGPWTTILVALDPDGPVVGCTWGGSRRWGPPIPNQRQRAVCRRPARWMRYDDDHGWYLCDVHRDSLGSDTG